MSQTNPDKSNEPIDIDEQGRVSIKDPSLAEAVEALSEEDLEDVAGSCGPTNQGCNNHCVAEASLEQA